MVDGWQCACAASRAMDQPLAIRAWTRRFAPVLSTSAGCCLPGLTCRMRCAVPVRTRGRLAPSWVDSSPFSVLWLTPAWAATLARLMPELTS